MNAKKVQPTRIDYPKHWFLLGTAVFASATAVLLYLAWTSIEDVVMIFWVLVAAFEGILLGYLFVVPLFTHHMLGAKGLKLRMGLLVNETIPYEWIREVRETSITWGGVRVGVGVRYSPIMRILFVTSSFQSLVAIKLDKERRLGSPFKRPVQEIVLSVHSASVFMDQLRERADAQVE
jgi:hypothetical protein